MSALLEEAEKKSHVLAILTINCDGGEEPWMKRRVASSGTIRPVRQGENVDVI